MAFVRVLSMVAAGTLSLAAATSAAADLAQPQTPAAGASRTIHVCKVKTPSRTCDYTSVSTALANVQSGGLVIIGPGVYRQGGVIRAHGVTVSGRRGTHILGAVTEGKAAFVVKGDNTTIQGLECSGITNADGNGACIRAEGRNLTVRKVYFHDSDEGILGGRDIGTVTVEQSRFERLGLDGYAHGIYIGFTDALVIRSSQFIRSKSEGHEIKSRAARTVIENSLVASMDGRDSRLIDIPNGGEIVIRNNVLAMGPNSANPQAIGIGHEVRTSEFGPHARNSTLIEGNVILLERQGENQLIDAPNVPFPIVRGNTIVGGDGSKVPAGNLWYPDRLAAGLQPYPSMRIPRSLLPKGDGATN